MSTWSITRAVPRLPAWCLGIAVLAAVCGHARAATIDLRVTPESENVSVSETFNVAFLANVPAPLLGFGFKLTFDEQLFKLLETTAAPAFTAAANVPADFISALAFPAPVGGAEVLLGTATFTVLDAGTGAFGIEVASADLTQGFAEVAVGALADFRVVMGRVTAAATSGGSGTTGPTLPEAATITLLGIGGALVFARRTA